MSEKDELRYRQRRFCCLYAALGDPEEAAVRAGFQREEALGAALRLLKSRSCRRRIKEHRELLADEGSVMAGLRRLAFGSCYDAVKLAFADELPPQEELDRLSRISSSLGSTRICPSTTSWTSICSFPMSLTRTAAHQAISS